MRTRMTARPIVQIVTVLRNVYLGGNENEYIRTGAVGQVDDLGNLIFKPEDIVGLSTESTTYSDVLMDGQMDRLQFAPVPVQA